MVCPVRAPPPPRSRRTGVREATVSWRAGKTRGRSPGTSRVSAAGEISLDSWVSRACFQCNAQGYWHCFRSRDASESQARRDHVIDPAMTERLPYLDAILCLDGLGAPYGDHAETRASRALHPNGGVFYCHGLRARDA